MARRKRCAALNDSTISSSVVNSTLRPLAGRPLFGEPRDLFRKVQVDGTVRLDHNRCSVPWEHIGRQVRIGVGPDRVRIFAGSEPIAEHARCEGRNQQLSVPILNIPLFPTLNVPLFPI